MAINKATLAKEIDGVIEYIYPKTTADIVEYDSTYTVEQKIQLLESSIGTVNDRVTNIASGVDEGTISSTNDAELIDIRIPNTAVVGDDVSYSSAGDAVRGQVGTLSEKIDAHTTQLTTIETSITDLSNELTNVRTVNTDVDKSGSIYTSAGNAVRAQVGALYDLIQDAYNGIYYEELSVDGEQLATSDGEGMVVESYICQVLASDLTALETSMRQEMKDAMASNNVQIESKINDVLELLTDVQDDIEQLYSGEFFEGLSVEGEQLCTDEKVQIGVRWTASDLVQGGIDAMATSLRAEIQNAITSNNRQIADDIDDVIDMIDDVEEDIDHLYSGEFIEGLSVDGEQLYTDGKVQIGVRWTAYDLVQDGVNATANTLRQEIQNAKNATIRLLTMDIDDLEDKVDSLNTDMTTYVDESIDTSESDMKHYISDYVSEQTASALAVS